MIDSSRSSLRPALVWLLALAGLAATHPSAQAQPTIVSTIPTMGTTGASPSAPVVITFSEAMNPGMTTAQFIDMTTYAFFPTLASWNAGYTRMTNTPVQPFPANKMIVWSVDGESLLGEPLDGTTGGFFTTGSSGGGGNDCTNQVGSLTLAKGALNQQTSASAPNLNVDAPYAFVACTTVACSNSTATGVRLTLPNATTTNLMGTTIPGHYVLTAPVTSLTALEGLFPNGNFTFNLWSSAGVLEAFPVTFPSTLTLPNAPHLTNFTAAQTIDATQPFTLGWDAFQNGTSADAIYVEIYGGVFQTPAVGTPSALNGTARTVTIPANTLQPNHTYSGAITFYDYVMVTNRYVTLLYRSSTTEFSLATSSGIPATPLVVTNMVKSAGSFSFEVTTAAGQALTVEYCTSLLSGQWQTLQTTNSPGNRVLITDPRAQTNRATFYRVKKG